MTLIVLLAIMITFGIALVVAFPTPVIHQMSRPLVVVSVMSPVSANVDVGVASSTTGTAGNRSARILEQDPITMDFSLSDESSTLPKRETNLVQIITSVPELLTSMQGGDDSSSKDLTIIKYHASYCKVCQRSGIQYKKLATEYPDVHFAKVEHQVLPHPTPMLKSLGVTKFPFIQFYRHGKCVASFSTGPSHLFVKMVRDTLQACRKRTDEEWQAFEEQFSKEIQDNIHARKALQNLESIQPQYQQQQLQQQ